jgi:hypothetical protein
MCTNQHQQNKALFHFHQHNTNNMLSTFFNNTQQQHNDKKVAIVGQQYIAINIVNVCSTPLHPKQCQLSSQLPSHLSLPVYCFTNKS